MKFKYSVLINRSINEVSKAFEDPEVMKICQNGFKEIILLTGEKGTKGATSKFVYEKFDLIETILENNLPEMFIGQYDHKYSSNTMKVTFKALDAQTTEYYTEVEYLKFRGFFMVLMSKIAPSFFKTQVKKWVDRFKKYLESKY